MYLGSVSKGRENNLDIIRLTAAILVIFCHAFPISQGSGCVDPLSELTHGATSFGNFAVCIFFFYGGFLIAGSVTRSKSGIEFFKKRISRLFPALFLVVLSCAFILGPILTNLGIIQYFTDLETYKYFLNAVLIPIHNLPGVFTNNIYNPTVNGPLWTLPIEFICYILCYILFALKITDQKKMKYSLLLFIPGYIAMHVLFANIPLLKEALRPMGMFYVGMLFYVYRDSIRMSGKIACIALVILIGGTFCNGFGYVALITLPYLFSYVGFAVKKISIPFLQKQDISYEIYLVAWPIQQILCYSFGGSMNPWLNFVCATVLAYIVGYFLHRLVQCTFMRKGKV